MKHVHPWRHQRRANLALCLHHCSGQAAYYVAAEALTNAAKHAGASQVTISAQRHDVVARASTADELMLKVRSYKARSRDRRRATVQAHVHSIFVKLELDQAPDTHRRVLAVLAYLGHT